MIMFWQSPGSTLWSQSLENQITKAQLIRPGVAYCVAGKVNSAGKLYLVIESIRPDTKHGRSSTVPIPAEGAGGSGID
jgi:hypothetical protein